ncbi:Ectonucleotide pyrophosphatase/phosphodiesterase member 6, variant 2 [Chamberlinius hualienensis]
MWIYLSAVFILMLSDGYQACLPLWKTDDQDNGNPLWNRKFLLILLDGFRWNYLDKPFLDGFDEIQKIGVRAQYSQPVFPSLSYPNYYTIVTGLYVQHHGITLNYMYNQNTKEKFGTGHYSDVWWNQVEPLWITTTKAQMNTDLYLWPGCQVNIKDALPHYCLPYSLRVTTMGFEDDLNKVVDSFFRNETSVALVYSEQPDLFGHLFGPDSFMLDVVVRRLDKILSRFIKNLRSKGLEDQVNVIIVSDHGMTAVDVWSAERIPMEDYMPMEDVDKILDRGAAVGIFPKEGKTDSIVDRLKSMPLSRVWKKEDIPESYYYKNNVNTPPILLLASPGNFIRAASDTSKSILSYENVPTSVADSAISGFHGYDPEGFEDMRGIFLGFGPDFKKGFRGPPIGNQDIYNLAMALIGISPNPNNGSWSAISMYADDSSISRLNEIVNCSSN